MKNYYQFYLDEKEKLVAEKKATIDSRINKARENTPIIGILLGEARESISSLQKELQKISIGKFPSRLHLIKIFDGNISDEDAFLECANEFAITNDENAILMLASLEASEEAFKYCEYLMNSRNKNRIYPETTSPNVSDNKKWDTKNPIWVRKNQTEFMQLIEGLIKLKRIAPRPNQTKWELINEIATFLGIELSKNKESNLGKGLKTKQVPKLFHDLHKTFVDLYDMNTRL
jgi:hypothetical protein